MKIKLWIAILGLGLLSGCSTYYGCGDDCWQYSCSSCERPCCRMVKPCDSFSYPACNGYYYPSCNNCR